MADLEAALAAELRADRIEDLHRLSGGASRETWSLDAVIDGDRRPLILQRERPTSGQPRAGMVRQAQLLRTAGDRGVPVPAVVAAGEGGELGQFVVVERLEGETIPRKILRDDTFAAARPRLAAQCGEALARIHAIPVEEVPGLAGSDQMTQFRDLLDALGQPHPTFELGFRWLEANRPASTRTAIVHGDFRNGNLIVGPDGLRAVIDWELAHVGDPMEDLGWLCVKSWRFGEEPRVGGFGETDELLAAYESASGVAVDPDVVLWWEVLGTLKWGVMCIIQAETHLSGMVRSVELAAIGRRVCEVEHDLLLLLPGGDAPLPEAGDDGPEPGQAPHDVPTAAQLVEATREFLERDVFEATDGRVRFHTRVAMNVLGMVERQLRLGPGQAAAHADRLRAIGVDDEAALARSIRDGALDDRWDEVVASVHETVRDKLLVANPGYI